MEELMEISDVICPHFETIIPINERVIRGEE